MRHKRKQLIFHFYWNTPVYPRFLCPTSKNFSKIEIIYVFHATFAPFTQVLKKYVVYLWLSSQEPLAWCRPSCKATSCPLNRDEVKHTVEFSGSDLDTSSVTWIISLWFSFSVKLNRVISGKGSRRWMRKDPEQMNSYKHMEYPVVAKNEISLRWQLRKKQDPRCTSKPADWTCFRFIF